MFRASSALAEGFLEKLDSLCSTPQLGSDAIYQQLAAFLHSPHNAVEFASLHRGDEQARIDRRVQQITELIEPLGHPASFCDVGCGTGVLTGALAQAWSLPPEVAYGVDVFDRLEERQAFTPVAVVQDSLLPLPDDTVELVLLLMTLHHEADAPALIAEVKRVLAPGGWVVVREADAATGSDRLFHAVLDHLYYAVYHQLPGIPAPENHRPVTEWSELFEKAGFEPRSVTFPEPESPIKPAHFVFVLR